MAVAIVAEKPTPKNIERSRDGAYIVRGYFGPKSSVQHTFAVLRNDRGDTEFRRHFSGPESSDPIFNSSKKDKPAGTDLELLTRMRSVVLPLDLTSKFVGVDELEHLFLSLRDAGAPSEMTAPVIGEIGRRKAGRRPHIVQE